MKKDFHKVHKKCIDYIPKGERATQFKPGDFILTHNSGFIQSCIRFGQSLRFSGEDAKYAHWNHCALIVSEQGDLVEALTKNGVEQSNLSKYTPKEYVVVQIDAPEHDRAQMVEFAKACLGTPYGFATIASIALSFLTGLKFSFGFDGQQICSGMVARALERTRAIFARGTSHICPADLAAYYEVEIPKEAQ